jgi:hypothetical protein
MTRGPPCPPPAMSSPFGIVVAMPFVGADDNNDGTAMLPQGLVFFEDVEGNHYDSLQKGDSKNCITLGSAILTDGKARALSDWEE